MRSSVFDGILRRLKLYRLGRSRGALLRSPRFYIFFVILAVVIALVAWPRDNIFTLSATTEVAGFTVLDPLLSEWMFSDVRLLTDPFDEMSNAVELASAVVLLNTGTRVQVQRHGVGEVRILLKADKSSVGTVGHAGGEEIELGQWALLVVSAGEQPVMLPFRGALVTGDDVAVGVDSILLAGTISVVEEQMMGSTHYIAGVSELDSGDRVRFMDRDGYTGREPAVVSGFVRAEPGGFSGAVNALTIVAHGSADYVQVNRIGSAGYRIRAPRWARFLHDPLLAAATAIVALLALLMEFFSKCTDVMASRRHDNE